MKFTVFKEKEQSNFEEYLLNLINKKTDTKLEEAMIYSLDAQGKRLRPFLLLAILESFDLDKSTGYPAAAAVEMIHTYSLIHDDLPAMDNDAIRRGKKANHIQFDEATAILAGDALLTLAFEVILEGKLSAEIKLKLSKLLAQTAGYRGMVGGQQADIEGEKRNLELEEIESIHQRKTGELIRMSVLAAGIIANKNQSILKKLATFSKELGIAYQMRDDLLDQVATEKEMGKGVRTDSALEKSTYPSILGIERAFEKFEIRLEKAKDAIFAIKKEAIYFNSDLLEDFIDQLSLKEYMK